MAWIFSLPLYAYWSKGKEVGKKRPVVREGWCANNFSVFDIMRLNEFPEEWWGGWHNFAGIMPKRATVGAEAEVGVWSVRN